jgi:outer membrane receptor protein involved in Fe transport
MNASAYIDVGEDFRLTFAVTNVFDRIGQRYYGAYIPGATSDLFGRRYNVGVRINY